MKRRVVAVILALVLAIVGAGLVIAYVRGADNRAVKAQHPVTAYIAKKLVPAGTSLATAQSQGLIVTEKVAQSGRPSGVLTVVDPSNSSLVATSDIQPGEFVMTARFGAKPVGQQAIGVPNGKVAISVQLTAPARVANFITPGSHIVIYATHSIKAAGEDPASKALNDLGINGTNVLLADVEVIAFGSKPLQNPSAGASLTDSKQVNNSGSGNGDAAYLVTVAVSPTDSVRLVHSINEYTLYAGLLGTGTKVNPKTESDDSSVFGGKSVLQGSTIAGSGGGSK